MGCDRARLRPVGATGAGLSAAGWSAQLARLGPFFAVEDEPGPGWHALRVQAEGEALDERVAHTRAALGRLAGAAVEARVAASTMSLGLFARLLSPALAAEVLGLELPPLTFDSVLWRPVPGGPWPLVLAGEPAPVQVRAVLEDLVLPLADVVASRHRLSPRVLRGNIASALLGAVRMLGSGREVAEPLLRGPLTGSGGGEPFVRASCCLYYRVPGGGYCGDCVLAFQRPFRLGS